MAIGLAGTILPMLPGLLLILAGILVYSWHIGFSEVGLKFLLVMSFLAIIGSIIDFMTTSIGAKKYGASKLGTAAVAVGLIFGLITLGPFGLIIGPIVAILAVELLLKGKSIKQAFNAVIGVVLGLFSGIAIRFFVGVAMILIFIFQLIL